MLNGVFHIRSRHRYRRIMVLGVSSCLKNAFESTPGMAERILYNFVRNEFSFTYSVPSAPASSFLSASFSRVSASSISLLHTSVNRIILRHWLSSVGRFCRIRFSVAPPGKSGTWDCWDQKEANRLPAGFAKASGICTLVIHQALIAHQHAFAAGCIPPGHYFFNQSGF